MKNLVSGMILVDKEYGDLHWLITTPGGWKAIDVDACCIEFDINRYEKAYIPKDYEDPWVPAAGTEIIFEVTE